MVANTWRRQNLPNLDMAEYTILRVYPLCMGKRHGNTA